MRRTKIVCTLGPSTDEGNLLEELILNGLCTARFNFSHGTHSEHLVRINKVKELREKLNIPVALLQDTKGPEIRLGLFENGPVSLVTGQEFTFSTTECIGNNTMASISFEGLVDDVTKGNIILVDDGQVAFEVQEITGDKIICKVLNEGKISNNKSLNVPNVSISLPALTPKDIGDLKFCVENDMDYVAASFVRTKQDVLTIRKILDDFGGKDVKIISKIENQEGIDNFYEILEVTDGIMVARGDLGVEIPIENLPVVQKRMIKDCLSSGKTVITATQMLDSMIKNPFPTRAEVSDIANAVYDGTGAIMLSGETACGLYPLKAVKMMAKVSECTELDIDYWKRFRKIDQVMNPENIDLTNNKDEMRKYLNYAVCNSAQYVNARAIVAVSEGGKTPKAIVKYRPKCPVYILTANKKTYFQMALEWGIVPIYVENEYDFDSILNKGIEKLKKQGLLSSGDIIALSGGVTLNEDNTDYLLNRSIGAIINI